MGSNNPFAAGPSNDFQNLQYMSVANAANRFPAIDGGQQQPQQQGYQQGYQQQQQQPMYAQPTGYAQSHTTGFVPSSGFGQNLYANGGLSLNFGVPSSSASPSGYQNGSMGSSQFYNPQPQQQQQQGMHQQLVADLDPFSGLNQQLYNSHQFSNGLNPQIQEQYQTQTTAAQQENRQQEMYGEHPRVYMKTHKAALEQWDQAAWGRARALFNQLEKAWEGRKKTVSEWQTWPLGMDDRETVDKLRKEADNNIDQVAAYTLQIKEVFESYRHSADSFSRTQVRQAMNEGLSILPDWPLTLQAPPKLTDSNQQQAPQQQQQYQQQQQQSQPQYQQQPPQQQSYQQGYQQQQQPQQQMMYAQQTGYPGGGGGGFQQQQQQPYQQQPQMTGMYGQQQQAPQQQQGMYRQW